MATVALLVDLLLRTDTALAQAPQYKTRPLPPPPEVGRPQFRTDRIGWITYIQPGGPADRAGRERGDWACS
jgi:hypothetical protein